jgi:hypothetical protein
VRFGGTVRFHIGEPIRAADVEGGRAGAAVLTERIQASLESLLADARPLPPPGPFGRWLSDLFNDRPWLLEGPANSTHGSE